MRRLSLWILAAFLALSAGVRAGETTIRFSWWGGGERHEATLKAIKLFEERNPDIKIKAEYMGFQGYVERLTTQIGGGAEPDVMQVNWAWIDMFSRKGDGLYDLAKVKQFLNLDEFTQDMIDSGMSNGVLNGLPVSMTTRFFIWNKTMWDKAGAKIPETWDDYVAAGPKFKTLGNDYYASDLEPIEGMYLVNAWLQEKYGNQIVDNKQPKIGLTAEQLADGISYFKKLQDAHAAVNAEVRTSRAGQYERPAEQVSEWVTGMWAGTFIWNSMFALRTAGPREKGFELAMGKMLTADGKDPNPPRIGRPAMMYVVGKTTKHPEAAAKLIAFLLTDPDAARIIGMTRGAPVAKSAYNALLKAKMFSEFDLAGDEQLKGSKWIYTSPLFEHERIRTFILEVLESVSHGKSTPMEAAERIVSDGNRILTRTAR